MRNCDRIVKALMAVTGVFICAAPVLAQPGGVLPPSANARGYSLKDMAAATAVYNTGVVFGNPLTPPPPDVPFQILEGDATVKPGTMLYLPIFFADDSGGAGPGFPSNINDQDACADYLGDLVLDDFDVTAFIVQVDGKTKVLDDDYIVGTPTVPLLDGTPAGTNYIVCAAFLSPLPPGKHTVAYGGIIDGQPVVFASMTVTVQPVHD
jgi:hypothetical protein